MQEFEINNAMAIVMTTACALSLAAGFFLFQRHVDGQSLLAYEPRRRSPWGPLVLVIPLFFIFIGLLPLVGNSDSAAEPVATEQFASSMLLFSVLMIAFVPAVMAWLIADRRANPHDLGLPENLRQFWEDARSGTIACLAALAPIFLLNYVLTMILRPEEIHPLIDQLQNNGSRAMLLVGFLSAVLAAPLFEEFTFRVLLQGWLERLEDERLDFRATERPTTPIVDYPDQIPEGPHEIDESIADEQSWVRPSRGWLPALPHGWTPILISSVLFGLAHVGHGVAPIPLVFLGIVLGYLYQRTHRIVPCIAAHMLFNAYSMTLLWMNLESTAP